MKKKKMTLMGKRAITGLLFITPWFIGFLLYYVKSLILTVKFSLSKVEIMQTGGYQTNFVGLSNFKYALLEHGSFNQILVDSLMDIMVDVPFIIFFSLLIAILLNTKFKGRTLVRAIFFIPIILGSGAVASSLALATQNIQGGAAATVADMAPTAGVNVEYFVHIFRELGLPKTLIDYIIGLVGRIYEIVRASSVQIIIFIASLQSIPGALYEVSKIEGATTYETFWKVTLPMVSPLILTNVVYTIVDKFVNSNVVDTSYEVAFKNYNYGLSTAMSLLSTILVCIILVVVGKILTKVTFYNS